MLSLYYVRDHQLYRQRGNFSPFQSSSFVHRLDTSVSLLEHLYRDVTGIYFATCYSYVLCLPVLVQVELCIMFGIIVR